MTSPTPRETQNSAWGAVAA